MWMARLRRQGGPIVTDKITVQRADTPAANFYMAKQPWVLKSACLSSDPDLFFDDIDGERGIIEKANAIKKAQSICAGCVVRQSCADQCMLEEADADEQHRFGFRAYMTAEQRVSIQRRGGLNGRDPMKLVQGRDGKRRVPPVPVDGDKWSRHHTTLARKVVRWVVDNVDIGAQLPQQAELATTLECKAEPLRRVLRALVQDGTLDFSGREGRGANANTTKYIRRGAPRVLGWLPTHLRDDDYEGLQ